MSLCKIASSTYRQASRLDSEVLVHFQPVRNLVPCSSSTAIVTGLSSQTAEMCVEKRNRHPGSSSKDDEVYTCVFELKERKNVGDVEERICRTGLELGTA